MKEWRPANTAPHDEYVLVYPAHVDGGYESGYCAVAKYLSEHDYWALGGSCGSNDNPINPTHWMPLPEKPGQAQNGLAEYVNDAVEFLEQNFTFLGPDGAKLEKVK